MAWQVTAYQTDWLIDWSIDRLCQWVCDYVSELRPPTGLMFTSQVIYGRGKPWWDDDASWGKLLTCPPELWRSTSRVIWGQVEGMDDRRENFALQEFCLYLQVTFTCCKVLQHGTSGFTSHPKEGVLQIYIALKNPLPRPCLNPLLLGPLATTLTTYYTTEVTDCTSRSNASFFYKLLLNFSFFKFWITEVLHNSENLFLVPWIFN
jgi:hypothetical protein